MECDIKLDKQIGYDVRYGISSLFINIKGFDMYWYAEEAKTLMDWYVIYNDKKYILKPDTSYGYRDKNWGRNFTFP